MTLHVTDVDKMDPNRSPALARSGQQTAAPPKPPDILGLKGNLFVCNRGKVVLSSLLRSQESLVVFILLFVVCRE